MSDNPRDTQFQGFAKSLLREMHEPISDYWREDCQEIIARRAYDLVKHAVIELQYDDNRYADDWVRKIPDMRELPKENK